MLLGEFLVALGVKADTEKVKQFSASLATVTKVAAVAVTALGAVALGTAKYFDGAIRNAENLAKTKGLLYDVTKEELAQSKKYIEASDKLGKSYDSIKTKIAFGMLPAMMEGIGAVNQFLSANKELITQGIQKVVEWLFRVIQVIVNVARFFDKVVGGTIGWKNALLLLAVALAIVKRGMILAFIANPVFWVIAAITALVLLIDDFMVYMDGGKSQFGEFWSEMLAWLDLNKEAIDQFFTNFKNGIKAILGFLNEYKVAILAAFTLVPLFKFIAMLVSVGKAVVTFARMISFAFAANPVGFLITAIGILIFMIYDFFKFLETGDSAFAPLWQAVIDFAEGTIQWLGDLWNSIINGVSEAIGAAVEWFNSLLASVSSVVDVATGIFGLMFGIITKPIADAINLVTGLFNIWSDGNTSFVDKLKATFSLVTDAIISPFKAAFDWVTSKFGSIIGTISSGISKIGSLFGSTTASMSAGAGGMSAAKPSLSGVRNSNSSSVVNTTVNIKTDNAQVASRATGNAIGRAAAIAANNQGGKVVS